MFQGKSLWTTALAGGESDIKLLQSVLKRNEFKFTSTGLNFNHVPILLIEFCCKPTNIYKIFVPPRR
jgi:hypothetical protein